MSALRPNSNASFVTERVFGLGAGLLIAAAILGDGKSSKSAVVGLVGAVIIIGSTIASIIVRRRQVRAATQQNLKAVSK